MVNKKNGKFDHPKLIEFKPAITFDFLATWGQRKI